MKGLKLAAILLVIPVLAFAVALYYEGQVDRQLQAELRTTYPDVAEDKIAAITTEAVMFQPSVYADVTFTPEVYLFVIMKYTAVGSALLGLGLMAAVALLSLWAARSRDLLSRIFPLTAAGAAVLVAVSTLVNGLLLVAALYYGESALIGSVHYVIIGFAGLGALFGAVGIVTALWSAFRPTPFVVDEAELPEDHPLVQEVKSVADTLGVAMPGAVVLGDAPTFYAYEGPFVTADYSQKGRLLYLSRELAQRLEPHELRAIVAHEFAHFLGRDLDYTVKFAFGYRALGNAVSALSESTDWTMVLGRLPALYLLGFVLDRFAVVERLNSRRRELEADKVAYTAYGTSQFATALTKVVLLAPALVKAGQWAEEDQPLASSLDKVLAEEGAALWEDAATRQQAHPFDTHPTLAERLAPMGLDVQEVLHQVLGSPQFAVSSLDTPST